jgi:heme/copper-type cytochrome/quinol oxidase subunit 4
MKKANKPRIKPIYLVALLSIIFVLALLFAIGDLTLLSIIGFLFFNIATGLGYYLSEKNDGKKSARFAKTLFIIAIVINVLGGLMAWWFSSVIGA